MRMFARKYIWLLEFLPKEYKIHEERGGIRQSEAATRETFWYTKSTAEETRGIVRFLALVQLARIPLALLERIQIGFFHI